MVMALRELPNVTLVGVATNGTQATMVGREAANGWYYSVPLQEVEAADGQAYEGPGIPVDVEILNDPVRVADGYDDMLQAAVDLFE